MPEGAPRILSPHEKLVSAGREALLRLIPEFKQKANSKDGSKLADLFVSDILAKENLPGSTFHRLSPERQEELLVDKDTKQFFTDVPQDIVDFYRKKIEELK